MRIVVLVINYIVFTLAILAIVSLVEDFNFDVILGVGIMLFVTIPNLIFAHMSKPKDTEKEELKKELEALKNRKTESL